MANLNIEKIYKEISTFSSERNWDQFHSIKNLSMALSVEASELLEIFQWMKEEESNDVCKDQTLMNRTEEEIADICIYLLRIVQKLDINLEDIILSKLQKNKAKYPVDKAKNNSKKYTDF